MPQHEYNPFQQYGMPLRWPRLPNILDPDKCTRMDCRPYTEGISFAYLVLDVAPKVVGVSSLGIRCLIIFMRRLKQDDPPFLHVKEAKTSILAPTPTAHLYNTRVPVIRGQRLIPEGFQNFFY